MSERLNRTAPLPGLPSLVNTRLGGAVYVDKSEILEELVIDSLGHKKLNGRSSQSISSDSTTSLEIQRRLVREQVRIKEEAVAAVTRANVDNSIRLAAKKKEDKFNHDVHDVEEAKQLLDVIDKHLEVFDETQRNKTRRQFEEWNTNVHGPIVVSH